ELTLTPALAALLVDGDTVTADILNLNVYLVNTWTFQGIAMNATADTIAMTNHGLTDGSVVTLAQATGGALPGGITVGDYYVIVVDANTIQLALSEGGDAVDFTTDVASDAAKFRLAQRGAAQSG